MEGKGVMDAGSPRTRPAPVRWLKETGWLKGCGGVDGGILVGVVEV